MSNAVKSLENFSTAPPAENYFTPSRVIVREPLWTRLNHVFTRSCFLNSCIDKHEDDLESGLSKQEKAKKPLSLKRTSSTFSLEEGIEEEGVCNICFNHVKKENSFFTLGSCNHKFCTICLITYLKIEINESRTDIACPQCSAGIHPNNIDILLENIPEYKSKYEEFMIRRYLVADPDSRWCPAPDCSYAVIASGCASCPQLKCLRESCGTSFCYHCKAEWHADQTCDAARAARSTLVKGCPRSKEDCARDEIKPCPRCQVLIVKMNDGSCNHMICAICGIEFCWLCMKEVSDVHYLSPSGCTYWGKKPWSRKKKIVWQVGTLIGAPVGIALLAGIAIPSMIIGIPVWIGKKLFQRYQMRPKFIRNMTVILGATVSILISPFLAGLAIAIGVPILLFYVYGVIPVSLCRTGYRESAQSFNKSNSIGRTDLENVNRPNVKESQLRIDGHSLLDAEKLRTAH